MTVLLGRESVIGVNTNVLPLLENEFLLENQYIIRTIAVCIKNTILLMT